MLFETLDEVRRQGHQAGWGGMGRSQAWRTGPVLAPPSGVGLSLLKPSPLYLPEEDLDPLRTQHSVVFAKAWTAGPRMGPSYRLEGTGKECLSQEMGIILAVTRGQGQH